MGANCEAGVAADLNKPEAQNARALTVLRRVKDKLTGRDFKPNEELSVDLQVDKLILQATNLEVWTSVPFLYCVG